MSRPTFLILLGNYYGLYTNCRHKGLTAGNATVKESRDCGGGKSGGSRLRQVCPYALLPSCFPAVMLWTAVPHHSLPRMLDTSTAWAQINMPLIRVYYVGMLCEGNQNTKNGDSKSSSELLVQAIYRNVSLHQYILCYLMAGTIFHETVLF